MGGVGEGGLKGREKGERTKGESGGKGEGTHHGGERWKRRGRVRRVYSDPKSVPPTVLYGKWT